MLIAGMSRRPARHGRRGFTLLEISIVIAIIAVIVAMAPPVLNSIDAARRAQTRKKLDAVEDSLMAYRLAYNRLPCPADPSLLTTNANYGVEAANPGSCVNGTPAAKFTNTTGTKVALEVVEGGVPFKALGLPPEFMYDGWGRKFAYAVNTTVTAVGAMVNQTLSEQCGITVNDASGKARTTGAIYALASFGQDGHGGFLMNGDRLDAGVTNTDELTNCHCTTTPITATGYNSTYVQKDDALDASDAVHPFDDLVRYKMRWQMLSPDDPYNTGGPTCQPGFVINGYASTSGYSDMSMAMGDVNGDGIPDLVLGFPHFNNVFVVFGTTTGFPDPLPLSSLNGSNGYELIGSYTSQDGNSVAVGDVNGDGVADIVIAGGGQGVVAVIFGQECGGLWPTACSPSYTITDAAAGNAPAPAAFINTNGIMFTGMAGNSTYGGTSVAVGDINGDGIPDIIMGDSWASPGGVSGAGSVYVVYGKKCGGLWGTVCGPSGITISTTSGSTAANVNSYTGLMVGQYLYANGIANGTYTGTYIASCGGGTACTSTSITLSVAATATETNTPLSVASDPINSTYLNGTNGVEFDGTVVGQQVAGEDAMNGPPPVAVGDVNGDGIADLVIGALGGNGGSGHGPGQVFVVFGSKTAPWTTSGTANALTSGASNFLNGTNGVELDTVGSQNTAGMSIAVGDVNGDGIADLVIGGVYYGAAVVFGVPSTTPGGWTSSATATTLNSTFLNGTNGTQFTCSASYCDFAASVAVADVNGDGIGDIIMGATNNGTTGTTYLVFGKTSGWPTTSTNLYGNTTFLNGTNGVQFNGITTSNTAAGAAVTAGDINGDGIADVIIGAPSASPGGVSDATSTYVFFGRKVGWANLTPYNLGNL
jgi:prepilin-type N-terminal cleavage/methylation domain-containing protein